MARRCAASPSRGEELGATNHNGRLKEEVSGWLCDWFVSRRKFEGDVARLVNINYFDAGLLTSLEVIEFVSEIEGRFGLQFSEQDFQDPRFVTVAGLSQLIAERSLQATNAEATER
jgi:acyl carrier protein